MLLFRYSPKQTHELQVRLSMLHVRISDLQFINCVLCQMTNKDKTINFDDLHFCLSIFTKPFQDGHFFQILQLDVRCVHGAAVYYTLLPYLMLSFVLLFTVDCNFIYTLLYHINLKVCSLSNLRY